MYSSHNSNIKCVSSTIKDIGFYYAINMDVASFLKVLPWRKILRFGKKEKLSPRFIGPYEILEKIGLVAYHLALPPELAKIHNVFYVPMLRRYRYDELHILSVQNVQV